MITGKVKTDMPVIKGVVEKTSGGGGTTKGWQEPWKDNVLAIARDDLGLEAVDGLLCAVYGEEDEEE